MQATEDLGWGSISGASKVEHEPALDGAAENLMHGPVFLVELA
jgi:hypothetical protein